MFYVEFTGMFALILLFNLLEISLFLICIPDNNQQAFSLWFLSCSVQKLDFFLKIVLVLFTTSIKQFICVQTVQHSSEPHFESSLIYVLMHKHKIHPCLTGSCRGVQLHFLRRFTLFLIGHCWSTAPSASTPTRPPPTSRARAATRVARLWRSKVGTSSSPARRRIVSI